MQQFKVRDGFIPADCSHAAFVEIPELLRLPAVDHPQNIAGSVTSLLHRNWRNSGQGLTGLMRKVRQIPDHLHFGMIRNRQILVHEHASNVVDGRAK